MKKEWETALMDDGCYASAITWAVLMHGGQKRDFSGSPYVSHPLRVASWFHNKGFDLEIVIAAMFHDVLEDTECTIDVMRDMWGDKVTDMVWWLTEPAKLRKATDTMTKAQRKEEFKQQLMKAPNIVQKIKLIDIMDNTIDMTRHVHLDLPRAKKFHAAKLDMVQSLPEGGYRLKRKVYGWLNELDRVIKIEEGKR